MRIMLYTWIEKCHREVPYSYKFYHGLLNYIQYIFRLIFQNVVSTSMLRSKIELSMILGKMHENWIEKEVCRKFILKDQKGCKNELALGVQKLVRAKMYAKKGGGGQKLSDQKLFNCRWKMNFYSIYIFWMKISKFMVKISSVLSIVPWILRLGSFSGSFLVCVLESSNFKK